MLTGTLVVDARLGDVHSLKGKRALVRPVLAHLRRAFPVSAAEVAHHDLHRRVGIGLAVVGSSGGYVRDVLDGCERLLDEHPELEVLAVARRLYGEGDDAEPA